MRTQLLLIACSSALLCSSASAYLGGFEAVDGYEDFLNDVATYNAGQYGTNAGGGTYVNIPDNTGLWQKLQGPLWPTPGLAGGAAYATAHFSRDRQFPGDPTRRGLVITTNADGWGAGPQEYSYQLDSFDLGGVAPASTAGDTLDISFWSCARIFGTGEGGGLGAGTIGDTVSFYDSSGNLGFEVGYRQPATTTDFAATNVGSWVQSAISVNPSTYHRWDVTLDLATQTVSIDVFESGVLTNLVSSAPLITPMSNLTELRFESTAGVNNAKIWSLDDFSMSARGIPEPTAAMLLLSTGLACSVRRGRRR